MKKILFLESKEMYESIGLNLLGYKNIEFDGMKYYKKFEKIHSNYRAIVSMLYHSPASNYVVLKSKEYGIPSFLVPDGIFDLANALDNPYHKKLKMKQYHPLLHDFLFCIGEDEKKYFESKGINVKKIITKRMIKNTNKIKLPLKQKFLITTANTPFFNEAEKQRLVDILKKIVLVLKEKEVEYIFRISNEELIKELEIKSVKNINYGSFENALKGVDSVLTTPSSIILSSIYNDRKVGMITYRDYPLFIQGGWLINGSIDFNTTIDSMLNGSDERMEYQHYQLKKYTENTTENLIEEILLNSKEKQKNKKFIDQNTENMLNSNFNFNFEIYARKLYRKLKKTKVLKKIKLLKK